MYIGCYFFILLFSNNYFRMKVFVCDRLEEKKQILLHTVCMEANVIPLVKFPFIDPKSLNVI